jgi:hypothetical protein
MRAMEPTAAAPASSTPARRRRPVR